MIRTFDSLLPTLAAALAILCCPLALQAEEAAPNTLTEAEKTAGWKLLFDGKSLDNWRRYNRQDTDGWAASDGALVLQKKGAGDLITREMFGDFEFAVDWKFNTGDNSGIIYRVKETKQPTYMTGPEMQVMPEGPDAKLGKNSGGSLYDMFTPSTNALRPRTEWNTYHILCQGNKIEHWVNGKKVVDCEIGNDEWNKAYASSKWKKVAEFASQKSGHIALQDHGASIAFRNLKIRPITAK